MRSPITNETGIEVNDVNECLGAKDGRNGHPHETHPHQKLTDEVDDALVAEVLSLRAELGRHKEEYARMEAQLASTQEENMTITVQFKQLKESQDRLREENWHLEITCQDMQGQLDRKDNHLAQTAAECQKERRQVEVMENLNAQQDKDYRMLDHNRGRLLRELRALKTENVNLQKQLENEININHQARSQQERSTPVAATNKTNSDTNVSVNIKLKELETLWQSLAQAHRIITGLRTSFDKEKLARIETAKLLAECQDVIEELSRPKLYRKQTSSSSSSILGRKRSKCRMSVVKQHSSPDIYYNRADDQMDVESVIVPTHTLFSELMEQQEKQHGGSNILRAGPAATVSYRKEAQTGLTSDLKTRRIQTSDNRLFDNNTDRCRAWINSGVQCDILTTPKPQKQQNHPERARRSSLTVLQAIRSNKATQLSNKADAYVNCSTYNRPSNRPGPISIPTTTTDAHCPEYSDNDYHLLSPPSLPPSSTRSSHILPCPDISMGTSSDTDLSNLRMITATKNSTLGVPSSASDTILKDSCRYTHRHASTTVSPHTSHTGCIFGNDPAVVWEGMIADPGLLKAITQVMAGDWMWKYTRRFASVMSQKKYLNEIGDNRTSTVSRERPNRRYFWIHPYTRTIFWSTFQLGGTAAKSKSKQALLKDVRSVPNLDRSPIIPFNLLIRTSSRDIMLHAGDLEQHYQWLSALCFLLGRPAATITKNMVSNSFSPVKQQEDSRSNNSNGRNSDTKSGVRNTGSHCLTNSSLILSIFPEAQHTDQVSDDDLINVRQCCNGKHDVTTLARE